MPKAEKPRQEHIFSKSEDENHRKPRTFKERFMDFYYDAIPYFTLNVAWFVMSLPLVTFFPALGGLYAAALTFNQESRADWSTVWEGFKKYWWLSLRWGLLVLFGDVILAVNIWFYLNIDQNWAVIALMLAIMISIFWMAIHRFSFPLLLLQDEKKIFLAIRNGYVIVMWQPLAALKVMLLSLVISVASILLPPLWIFVSMALIAQLRTRAVLKAVKRIKEKDADRGSVKTHQQGKNSDQENNEDLE